MVSKGRKKILRAVAVRQILHSYAQLLCILQILPAFQLRLPESTRILLINQKNRWIIKNAIPVQVFITELFRQPVASGKGQRLQALLPLQATQGTPLCQHHVRLNAIRLQLVDCLQLQLLLLLIEGCHKILCKLIIQLRI